MTASTPNRKRIVELMQQAANNGNGVPDAAWVVRFLNLLREENPIFTKTLKDGVVQKLKAREQ
jgi:hypothetical protein